MNNLPEHVSFLSHFRGSHIIVTQPDRENGATWHHHLGDDMKTVNKRNESNCGVFFTINSLNQKLDPDHKRTKRMLTHLRALYADDDKPRGSSRTDWAIPPSLVVKSSGNNNGFKFHYYWLIDEPIKCSHDSPEAKEYGQILKGIAEQYNTDPSSSQVNRVLRLPGFKHCKNTPQKVQVATTENMGVRYSWETLKQAFPPLNEPIYNDSEYSPSNGDWKKHLTTIWEKKGEEAWPHYSAAAMSLANGKCDMMVAIELITGEVLQAFKDNNRPIESWRVDNIWDSVKSAYEKVEREQKEGIEDPLPFETDYHTDPFPVELLPNIVQEAVKEYARFIQVAPDAICASALSAMATVMGNKVSVVELPGLEHFPSLGFIIAAGSGERKSPIFSHMFQPVKDIEQELVKKWKRKSATNAIKANTLAKRIKAEIKKLEDDVDEDENEEEVAHIAALQEKLSNILPKAKPQLYGMDITEETLGKVLSEQNGEFALLSAEARGIIDNITGKYSKGDKTGDSIILSAMTGDEIRNSRGGNSDAENRSSYIIEKPCLNLCLFIQPDKAIELIGHPKLADSGLLARTFILTPESRIGTRMREKGDLGIDVGKTNGYHRAIYRVGVACSSSERKIKMVLSEGAQEMHRLFNNDIEKRFVGDLSSSIHLFNKIVSSSVKISAILTGLSRSSEFADAIEHGNKLAEDNKILQGQPIIYEIDAEVYSYALQIIEYMIGMIRNSHEEMSQARNNILARDYLKWVSTSKNRDKILKRPFTGKGGMLVNWSGERFRHDLGTIYHMLVLRNWAYVSDDGICIRKDFLKYSELFNVVGQ